MEVINIAKMSPFGHLIDAIDRKKKFIIVAIDEQGTAAQLKTIPALIVAEDVIWVSDDGDQPRRLKLLLDPSSLWWGDNGGQSDTREWRETDGGIRCCINQEILLLNPYLLRRGL